MKYILSFVSGTILIFLVLPICNLLGLEYKALYSLIFALVFGIVGYVINYKSKDKRAVFIYGVLLGLGGLTPFLYALINELRNMVFYWAILHLFGRF